MPALTASLKENGRDTHANSLLKLSITIPVGNRNGMDSIVKGDPEHSTATDPTCLRFNPHPGHGLPRGLADARADDSTTHNWVPL